MGWIGGVRVNEELATQTHDGGGRKLPTKSSCCPVSSSIKVNSQHTVNALMGKFCALSIAWSLYTFMCCRAGGPTQSPVRSGPRVTVAAPDSKYQRFVPQQSVNIGLRLRNNIRVYWCYSEVLKYSRLTTKQKSTPKISFDDNCSHVFICLKTKRITTLCWQNNKKVSYPVKRMISIPSHHQENYCSRGNYCFIYCHVFMLQEIRDVRVLVLRSSHHLFPVLRRDPLSPLHIREFYQKAPFHLFIYDFIMKKSSSTSSCRPMSSLWKSLLPPLHVCVYYE